MSAGACAGVRGALRGPGHGIGGEPGKTSPGETASEPDEPGKISPGKPSEPASGGRAAGESASAGISAGVNSGSLQPPRAASVERNFQLLGIDIEPFGGGAPFN